MLIALGLGWAYAKREKHLSLHYLWFNYSGPQEVLLARHWFYWSRATGPLLVSNAAHM